MFKKIIIGIILAGLLVSTNNLPAEEEKSDSETKQKQEEAKSRTGEKAVRKAAPRRPVQGQFGQVNFDKCFNDFTKAYQENDREKMGRLLREMNQTRQRMANAREDFSRVRQGFHGGGGRDRQESYRQHGGRGGRMQGFRRQGMGKRGRNFQGRGGKGRDGRGFRSRGMNKRGRGFSRGRGFGRSGGGFGHEGGRSFGHGGSRGLGHGGGGRGFGHRGGGGFHHGGMGMHGGRMSRRPDLDW